MDSACPPPSGLAAFFPDPCEVPHTASGFVQLLFLMLTYAAILFRAAGCISDGSEELMLVLSPGLVGGFILPVLGAVPDGAIVLFSGLGPADAVQAQLRVGVGTLAGSSIMLLTLPWAACTLLGRVDLSADGRSARFARGLRRTWAEGWGAMLTRTGVQTSGVLVPAARAMLLTCAPYLLIAVPAVAIGGFGGGGATVAETAAREKWWALAGLLASLAGFACYSAYQVLSSNALGRQELAQTHARRLALSRHLISTKAVAVVEEALAAGRAEARADALELPLAADGAPHARGALEAYARALFKHYDTDGNGSLDGSEVKAMLKGLGLAKSSFGSSTGALMSMLGGEDKLVQVEEVSAGARCARRGRLQRRGDLISPPPPLQFVELVKTASAAGPDAAPAERAAPPSAHVQSAAEEDAEGAEGEEEEEEEEEEEDGKRDRSLWQIRKDACKTLFMGIALVTVFSDPMVDVLSEIGARTNIPPFYVSFIVTPIVSNASEVISGVIQASKKKRANLDVSYSQFLGAAVLNNTFVLAIFLLLVFVRGLAWEFTAEVLAIILVQLAVAALIFTDVNHVTPLWKGLVAGALFPLSLVFVWVMENVLGWD